MRLSVWFLFLLFLSCLSESPSFAYTAFTHEILVGEAFDYMYMEENGENYQEFLERWSAGMHKDFPLRETLMAGANAADARTDLYYRRTSDFGKVMGAFLGIDDCFQKLNLPFAYDGHLTAMQHFLVLPGGEGKIWPYDGYSYQTSDKTKDDYWAFGFFLVYYSGVKIDTEQCGGPDLPEWFARDVRMGRGWNFRNNFRQEIPYVVYPPATSVAGYDYDQFLQSISPTLRPGPNGLEALARVLHLAQDMTVPHHVIGLLGEGHEDYEKIVEIWVQKTSDLIDHNRIAEHLQERECFPAACSLAILFDRLARYTLAFESGKKRIDKNKHYTPGAINEVEAFARAKYLVNMAIASNVVILKKAWQDWSQKHPQAWLLPAGSKIKPKPPALKSRPYGNLTPREAAEVRARVRKALGRGPSPSLKNKSNPRKTLESTKGKKLKKPRLPHEIPTRRIPTHLTRKERLKTAIREFSRLRPDQVLHLAVPERLRPQFGEVVQKTRDVIVELAQNRAMPQNTFKERMMAGVSEYSNLLRDLSVKDIEVSRKDGGKRTPTPIQHNLDKKTFGPDAGNFWKAIEQQQLYDSMKLCQQSVVFRAVLERFPPNHDLATPGEIERYQRTKKEWDRGLELFHNYVQALPALE